MSAGRAPTVGTTVFVLYGPLVWAVHLLLTYGGHASMCEFEVAVRWDLPVLQMLLWGATLLALAALLAGLVWTPRLRRLLRIAGNGSELAWLEGLMRLLAALSVLAVSYSGIAILTVAQCLQLR